MNTTTNVNNPVENIFTTLISGSYDMQKLLLSPNMPSLLPFAGINELLQSPVIPHLLLAPDMPSLLPYYYTKSIMNSEIVPPPFDIYLKNISAANNMLLGLTKYNNDFFMPLFTATLYFINVELSKLYKDPPIEQWNAYIKLLKFNMEIFSRYHSGSLGALEKFIETESKNLCAALFNTIFQCDGEKLDDFFNRQFEMVEGVTQTFPKAVKEIEPEYGFHFERNGQKPFAETKRFFVYEVLPTDKDVQINKKAKPILIIPPFVLGSNILGFLPDEKRSYAHCFANQGIPTYIRIMKDIKTTPAFQLMTMEEDAIDTRFFCQNIMDKHEKKVTLNGYCQGGYSAVCNILSGELDSVVDALITCVAPMDGTRSKGLGHFLTSLPPQFNDLIYGTKTLSNGNKVADGNLMGWVYKLKSIEHEAPLVSFFRDMLMVAKVDGRPAKLSKTALALNYWLQNERTDIPLNITAMSFASYNTPVTQDGTLPVTMFGKAINFKTIEEKEIPWLLCYGEKDDLVEKATALAPLDYINVETTPFPKGHVAMATSWSHPESPYALHTRFGSEKQFRGPVRFQMDLDAAIK
ncbi:MAG: metal transporter [Desulfamplus sp.]|nr:metal transporter [Desulfamplus sp.]